MATFFTKFQLSERRHAIIGTIDQDVYLSADDEDTAVLRVIRKNIYEAIDFEVFIEIPYYARPLCHMDCDSTSIAIYSISTCKKYVYALAYGHPIDQPNQYSLTLLRICISDRQVTLYQYSTLPSTFPQCQMCFGCQDVIMRPLSDSEFMVIPTTIIHNRNRTYSRGQYHLPQLCEFFKIDILETGQFVFSQKEVYLPSEMAHELSRITPISSDCKTWLIESDGKVHVVNVDTLVHKSYANSPDTELSLGANDSHQHTIHFADNRIWIVDSPFHEDGHQSFQLFEAFINHEMAMVKCIRRFVFESNRIQPASLLFRSRSDVFYQDGILMRLINGAFLTAIMRRPRLSEISYLSLQKVVGVESPLCGENEKKALMICSKGISQAEINQKLDIWQETRFVPKVENIDFY